MEYEIETLMFNIKKNGKKISGSGEIFFLSDSLTEVKEKIFLTNNNFIQELISLRAPELVRSKGYVYEVLIGNTVEIDYLMDTPLNLGALGNRQEFMILFEYLQKTYLELTEADLKFVLMIQSKDSTWKHEIMAYVESKTSILKNLQEKYKKLGLFPLNDIMIDVSKVTKKFNLSKYDSHYSYSEYKSTSGISNIDLNEIFNFVEIGEHIILVGIGKGKRVNPIYKVAKDIPAKGLRKLVLNENTKLGKVSYKILNGLLIKYMIEDGYIDFILEYNGNITIRVYKDSSEKDHDILARRIHKHAIRYLNQMNLGLLRNDLELDTADVVYHTNFINKKGLERLLLHSYISRLLNFSVKSIRGDYLSFTYKGITVRVEDNPYEDSSFIHINKVSEIHDLSFIIFKWIYALNLLTESEKRTLKNKTKNLLLKEQGIKINARKCQSNQQPSIDDKDIETYRSIKFENELYKCRNDGYPHPGFNSLNEVCCFKKDQRGDQKYIQNVHPTTLETYVRPSNFTVIITEKGKNKRVNVIKLDSSKIDLYGYITPVKDKLVLRYIDDEKLEETISSKPSSIWLNRVPLSKLLYPSTTIQCKVPINFSTGACPSGSSFGYNTYSIPCCLKNSPIGIKASKIKYSKSYVVKFGHNLDYDHLGAMPPLLDVTKTKYNRLGNSHTDNSLMNIVVNVSKLSSVNELRDELGQQNIEDYLKVNIIIIEVQGDDISIICDPFKGHWGISSKYDKNIVILKDETRYEMIVKVVNDDIEYKFSNEEEIVNLLRKYAKSSCSTTKKYPENYTYEPLKNVSKVLGDNETQVVTDKGHVQFVMRQDNTLIPVEEQTSLEGRKSILFKDYRPVAFSRYNQNDFLGVAESDDPSIVGLLSKYGVFIPVLKQKEFGNLPILFEMYYSKIHGKNLDEGKDAEDESFEKYIKYYGDLQTDIHDAKKVIRDLPDNVKRRISIIVTDVSMSRGTKVKKLLGLTELKDKIRDDILKLIVYDIINNDLVSRNAIGIHVRDDEQMLTNIDDIKKFL